MWLFLHSACFCLQSEAIPLVEKYLGNLEGKFNVAMTVPVRAPE